MPDLLYPCLASLIVGLAAGLGLGFRLAGCRRNPYQIPTKR